MAMPVITFTVVKMDVNIPVDKEDTLDKLKEKILAIVWANANVAPHGHAKQLIIKDMNEEEITTTEMLQERIGACLNFKVVIARHG